MTENQFQISRAMAIARKEFAHILRDKFTIAMALGLPLIVVFIFGIAIEFNQKDIPTAVFDQSKSFSSRELIRTMSSSNYFIVERVGSFDEAYKFLESERVKAAIVIPPDFEKNAHSLREAKVQVLVNAADNAAAGSILSYLSQIRTLANTQVIGERTPIGVKIESRYLFNPELNSKWFTVPGLVVLIMAMIAILLTALTIAKEWEFGSMELLLSTPVKPLELILGKITPYAVLCLFAILLVFFTAIWGFKVPFNGNFFVYLLGCVLFLVSYLAQGLMISVITRKQMLAMQFSMISGLLPSMLLSGFTFPIENMPKFFQYLTLILPARWFMEISRESFLQGATFWQMKTSFACLTAIMIFFVFVSLKKFKKDLEP